ncbi:alpha/beta fold hydrolase [Salegentibacter salegens]|uniref:Pimeloyl-ACP methyl ester carboxylesterase n=1 Tax=Salegentibacter salegens TaxID=143223 RepID=A0A1M7JP74_9FLAO|nr:alpha/beta hydrolase [Salegentibacter salegens]PRX51885.1 pimeloyl-ACP methyl ester carboxylesterase [Salegentibacter salegens]SHM54808.1 Pimeloyl-ACP methyl ester carboxylesterase [Salegentibacter salegens]
MNKQQKDQIPVQRLLVPNYIRYTGNILSKLSPFVASRFAGQLFLTPFKYKLPEREKNMDEHSKQYRAKILKTGREIVVYEFGKSKKKILLVHGWSGRGTQLAKIAEALKAQGYSTISFDAPAHGKAPGKKSMMLDFIDSVQFLDEKYGPFEAIIGHSLGGMTTLRAVKEGLNTKKLVIIGTANSITHITREFARNLKMNRKVADKMKAHFDKKFDIDMDSYSGAVSAKEVKTPTLVIHDENDVDVEISSAYDIHEALENSELYITKGLGHRRILGDSKVINKITTFIAV